jgi:hypothetical protein
VGCPATDAAGQTAVRSGSLGVSGSPPARLASVAAPGERRDRPLLAKASAPAPPHFSLPKRHSKYLLVAERGAISTSGYAIAPDSREVLPWL